MSSFRSSYYAIRISLLVTFFLLHLVILCSSAAILAPVKAASQREAEVALTAAIFGSVFGILFFLATFIRVVAPYSGFFILVAWEFCWLASVLLMQISTLILIGNPKKTFCAVNGNGVCHVGEGVVTTALALVVIFTVCLLLGNLSRCYVHRYYGPQWWYVFRADVVILGRQPINVREKLGKQDNELPDALYDSAADADSLFHEVSLFDLRASSAGVMYPNQKQTTHGGKVADTGYDRDRRPSWARAINISRGRDHPYPKVPPQSKPKMRSRSYDEPYPRGQTAGRSVSDLRSPPPIYSHEKPVPSLLFTSFNDPQVPTLLPSDSASNIFARSDVSLYSIDVYLHDATPPKARIPQLREMPSRTTVWSKESWVPGDDGALLPPLPTADQASFQFRGSWLSADRTNTTPPPVPAKDVVKTKSRSSRKSTKKSVPRDVPGRYWVQTVTNDHEY